MQLVRSRTLPDMSFEMLGEAPDGTFSFASRLLDREYRGTPLLLEVVATGEQPSDVMWWEVRALLGAQTARIVGMMAWSWPLTVGVKLRDALLRLSEDDGTWHSADAFKVQVTGGFDSPGKLSLELGRTETQLSSLSLARQRAADSAMRWWHYGLELDSAADRLIAYWIILETVANSLHPSGSIHERVRALLAQVFPGLPGPGDQGAIRRLELVLSDARNSAVHGGRRDLRKPLAVTGVAECAAQGAIEILLGLPASVGLPKEACEELGIPAT